MTSLKESLMKFRASNINNTLEEASRLSISHADGYIKELEELTLICPRHKLDRFSTMAEKWAFRQGYQFCREDMLRFLRGD
jgi:hypothetical protein